MARRRLQGNNHREAVSREVPCVERMERREPPMNLTTPNGVEHGLGTGIVRSLAGQKRRMDGGRTWPVGFTHGYSAFTLSGCARVARSFEFQKLRGSLR